MNADGPGTQRVWELFARRLEAFLRARVGDEHLAADLLQETFLRIHRRLPSVRDDERLAPWVFQIARNLVVDHFRAQARAASAAAEAVAAEAETPDDAANRNLEVMAWLPSSIDALPETYRDAVRLYELEALPHKEIADRLGLSLSGTKSRVQRGRALLKKNIHDCCVFELDRRGNVLDYAPRRASDVCDCPPPRSDSASDREVSR